MSEFTQKELFAFAGQGIKHVKAIKAKLERYISDNSLSPSKRDDYRRKLEQIDNLLKGNR